MYSLPNISFLFILYLFIIIVIFGVEMWFEINSY